MSDLSALEEKDLDEIKKSPIKKKSHSRNLSGKTLYRKTRVPTSSYFAATKVFIISGYKF